jgi:hypothetical protein
MKTTRRKYPLRNRHDMIPYGRSWQDSCYRRHHHQHRRCPHGLDDENDHLPMEILLPTIELRTEVHRLECYLLNIIGITSIMSKRSTTTWYKYHHTKQNKLVSNHSYSDLYIWYYSVAIHCASDKCDNRNTGYRIPAHDKRPYPQHVENIPTLHMASESSKTVVSVMRSGDRKDAFRFNDGR